MLASGAVPIITKEANGKTKIQGVISSLNNRTKPVFVTAPTNPTSTFGLLRRLPHNRVALLTDLTHSEHVADDKYNDGKAVC